MVSITRAQANTFMKPRALFHFRNHYKGNDNVKTSLGDLIHRYINSDKFIPNCLLDCLDLASDHHALEIANRVEAAIYAWRRKTTSKTSWGIVKDFVSESDKPDQLADRAESLLIGLKRRFRGLPQTTLDMNKIHYNKDPITFGMLKGSHNIGIAMATPHGLVVPNIKKVQSLSILEITKELSRLQQSALANKLSSDDISGGTITLSNIGAIGGKFGSPLINVAEVSIIAIGRIQKVPQFDDDENVYPASIMTVNIGADHRVLDGATVAKFCNEWKLFNEKPQLLMLQMR